jgi:D-tagatose-1,6-bisphosphate aldolase subunit GatZ/KbaZ
MSKSHPLKEIIECQKKGISKGIYSICSANEYVIEAAMEKAKKESTYVLIESTANQVNQFGGYTGMKPSDFKAFVLNIAEKTDFPKNRIILGGDHLGPLTWSNESSSVAIEKSCELLRQYVIAGFTKIHIDTSMRLADDPADIRLDSGIIAERGAVLCLAAEKAFEDYKKGHPDALHPVYVVGSEVPIPGGSQEAEEGVKVTEVSDFLDTVEVFKKAFFNFKLQAAWENVIAVVVQPGVEFGDESIHQYNRKNASDLSESLKKYPDLIFEGHSTDYQTAASLKQMVEDGIAILKVGPALTFALREALFALSLIENELYKDMPGFVLSNFTETLDQAMVKSPDNWKRHYHGGVSKIKFARKYSFSDRCRYYLPVREVQDSLRRLLNNLRSTEIPLSLLSQFMPIQYVKVRNGLIKNDPEILIKDRIKNLLDEYHFAVTPKR